MGCAVSVFKQLAARGFLRLRGPWPPGSTPQRGLRAHVPGYHAITHHPTHTSIYSCYELPVAAVLPEVTPNCAGGVSRATSDRKSVAFECPARSESRYGRIRRPPPVSDDAYSDQGIFLVGAIHLR